MAHPSSHLLTAEPGAVGGACPACYPAGSLAVTRMRRRRGNARGEVVLDRDLAAAQDGEQALAVVGVGRVGDLAAAASARRSPMRAA